MGYMHFGKTDQSAARGTDKILWDEVGLHRLVAVAVPGVLHVHEDAAARGRFCTNLCPAATSVMAAQSDTT